MLHPAVPLPRPMDFAFYRFLERLNRNFRRLTTVMSALSDRVASVLQFLQGEKAQLKNDLAEAKEALAAALANDAADAEAIAAAEAEAAAARLEADSAIRKVAELQNLADADAAEDAAIIAALDAVAGAPGAPEPEPTPEPAPEEEPEAEPEA